jgi:hypothetical protein
MQKPLVTRHAVSSRLAKLGKPSAPKPTTAQRAPSRPSAPPTRIAQAPKPRNEAPNKGRAVDLGRIDATTSLVRMGQRLQAVRPNSDDNELEFENSSTQSAFVDLSKLDPGPDASDVSCGYNCASCMKFLALNDPRRDDPEFMERYLSIANHCPVALPNIVKIPKNKTIDDIVARANTVACSKFKLNKHKASEHLVLAIDTIRLLTKGEFDVVASSLGEISKQKALEEKYGSRIGDAVTTSVSGYDGNYKGRVIGFQGKNLLIRVTIGKKELTVRRPVIDAKPIED